MTTRERLPNRRPCESFEFSHAGLDFTVAAGFYPDGRIAEIFFRRTSRARRSKRLPEMQRSRCRSRCNLAFTLKQSGKPRPRNMTAVRRAARRGA